MSSTALVGLFEDAIQAQQARQRLQQAGVSEQSIRINAGASSKGETAGETQPREEEGAISRFFSDLFGTSDAPDAHHYDEAVRRGNVVLTVQVDDESRLEAISDLLEDSGAVDVDERVESWKSTGDAPMNARAANTGGPATDLVSDDVLDMGEARQLSAAGADDADADAMKVAEKESMAEARRLQRGSMRVRRYGMQPQAANMASRYAGPERRMGNAHGYGGSERRAAA